MYNTAVIAAPARFGTILQARGLRAFADGLIAVILPVHLDRLGFGVVAIGAIVTATLLGSSLLTLALGFSAHRLRLRRWLLLAALLMAGTGLGFAGLREFWPLLLVAFVGTLNPTGGDVSLFLPLEHTAIAHLAADTERTAIYARYAFIGSIGGALGALAAGALDWLDTLLPPQTASACLFLAYGVVGLAAFLLYLPVADIEAPGTQTSTGLGPSRGMVWKLAALFSIDSCGGGFIPNSLLAVWFFQHFGMSVAAAGGIFFVIGICSAVSYFIAVRLAGRFGLVNTMVFTHLPSSVFLILAAFAPNWQLAVAALVLRGLLSQMDVPTRSSYVMAIVQPAERPAAASITAAPRGLAAAISPVISGWALSLSAFGWPLIFAGTLKIVYDIALLHQFRTIRPPEEQPAKSRQNG